MLGQTCTVCESGTYVETRLEDDWYGTLHCSTCGNETRRHRDIPEESAPFLSPAAVSSLIGTVFFVLLGVVLLIAGLITG